MKKPIYLRYTKSVGPYSTKLEIEYSGCQYALRATLNEIQRGRIKPPMSPWRWGILWWIWRVLLTLGFTFLTS